MTQKTIHILPVLQIQNSILMKNRFATLNASVDFSHFLQASSLSDGISWVFMAVPLLKLVNLSPGPWSSSSLHWTSATLRAWPKRPKFALIRMYQVPLNALIICWGLQLGANEMLDLHWSSKIWWTRDSRPKHWETDRRYGTDMDKLSATLLMAVKHRMPENLCLHLSLHLLKSVFPRSNIRLRYLKGWRPPSWNHIYVYICK